MSLYFDRYRSRCIHVYKTFTGNTFTCFIFNAAEYRRWAEVAALQARNTIRANMNLVISRADNYKQIAKCWRSENEIKYNVKPGRYKIRVIKSLLKFASNFLWSMHEYGYTVNKALEQTHTRSIHLIHMYFIRAWTKLSLIRACTPWYCDAHSYALQNLL